MRYVRNTLLTGLIVMGALSWSCVRNLPPVAPQSTETAVNTTPVETPNRVPARTQSSGLGGNLSSTPAVSQIGPTNDLPNPYTTVVGWAKMPGSRTWGATSAVDIDPDGKHIWVAERCEANACEGLTLDPVLKFDEFGHLVHSFGAGLMNWPHGFYVHDDGSVWVTDARGGGGKGHQVHKFSPNGDLLLSLGTAGVSGTDGPL
ncbi:MAG: hypothetical protein Ct9H300mP25_04640 [Acidobacteriota bacterium]|nr:MAG: hypothetical protein Ct9H300mP25_04640 [Acidobacteriota bacterium]